MFFPPTWVLDINRNTIASPLPLSVLSTTQATRPPDENTPFSLRNLFSIPKVRTDSVVQTLTADHEHVRLDVCLKRLFHPTLSLRRPFFPQKTRHFSSFRSFSCPPEFSPTRCRWLPSDLKHHAIPSGRLAELAHAQLCQPGEERASGDDSRICAARAGHTRPRRPHLHSCADIKGIRAG